MAKLLMAILMFAGFEAKSLKEAVDDSLVDLRPIVLLGVEYNNTC
jgi:hypothetical protein